MGKQSENQREYNSKSTAKIKGAVTVYYGFTEEYGFYKGKSARSAERNLLIFNAVSKGIIWNYNNEYKKQSPPEGFGIIIMGATPEIRGEGDFRPQLRRRRHFFARRFALIFLSKSLVKPTNFARRFAPIFLSKSLVN